MWNVILPALIKEGADILQKYIKDKKQAEEAARELSLTVLKKQADIIIAETQSESWLTRNWRPITMLTFVALVVADWLGFSAPGLDPELKKELYSIIKTGLVGYIAARTVEKTAEKVAQKKKEDFINLFK